MSPDLTLVSHALCPYVQRIAIALAEKGMAHERVTVDLADKPAWFLALSPFGRTPVLRAGSAALFESAAILEYLEETGPRPLLPADPVERARHRAWIGVSSECLADVAAAYSTPAEDVLATRIAALHGRFRRLESHLGPGPWFAGDRFGLVDAVFAPVLRYLDTFERIGVRGALEGLPGIAPWRTALSARPSVRDAVAADYDTRLLRFVAGRGGAMARMAAAAVDLPARA